MSCCGKGRESVSLPVMPNGKVSIPPSSRAGAPSFASTFEYVGRSSMTVVSPLTGMRYHFPNRGARLTIDARDRAMLLGVPNVREVRVV